MFLIVVFGRMDGTFFKMSLVKSILVAAKFDSICDSFWSSLSSSFAFILFSIFEEAFYFVEKEEETVSPDTPLSFVFGAGSFDFNFLVDT